MGLKKCSKAPLGVFVFRKGGEIWDYLYIKSTNNRKLYELDCKVLDVSDWKARRPFVGILIEVNDIKYVALLSSPKKKHLSMKNTIDFYKIDQGKLGAINFNNMIPVRDKYIIKVNPFEMNIFNEEDKKYIKLLNKQLRLDNYIWKIDCPKKFMIDVLTLKY